MDNLELLITLTLYKLECPLSGTEFFIRVVEFIFRRSRGTCKVYARYMVCKNVLIMRAFGQWN